MHLLLLGLLSLCVAQEDDEEQYLAAPDMSLFADELDNAPLIADDGERSAPSRDGYYVDEFDRTPFEANAERLAELKEAAKAISKAYNAGQKLKDFSIDSMMTSGNMYKSERPTKTLPNSYVRSTKTEVEKGDWFSKGSDKKGLGVDTFKGDDDDDDIADFPTPEPTYNFVWPKNFDYDLVIMIACHNKEIVRRCSIRDGWMRAINNPKICPLCQKRKVKVVFLVGSKFQNAGDREIVEKEQKQFGDIFALDSMTDQYLQLSRKIRNGFQWVVENFTFRVLMKCDSDSYVHMNRLLSVLDEHNAWTTPGLYMGNFDQGLDAPVMWQKNKKSEKWYDPFYKQHTGLKVYPVHAKGPGYFLTYDLAKYLAHPAVPFAEFTCEDTAIGTWLMPVQHTRINIGVHIMEPHCDCSGVCVGGDDKGMRGKKVEVDHYVPPWMMRMRARRGELFGDECHATVDRDGYYVSKTRRTPRLAKPAKSRVRGGDGAGNGADDEPGGILASMFQKKTKPKFTLGTCPVTQNLGLHQREYAHNLITNADIPDGVEVDSHPDTRSGVCSLTFSWHAELSKCSKRCGGGVLGRCVVCKGSDGFTYDDIECSGEKPPQSEEACNTEPCQEWDEAGHGYCATGFLGEESGLSLEDCQATCGANCKYVAFRDGRRPSQMYCMTYSSACNVKYLRKGPYTLYVKPASYVEAEKIETERLGMTDDDLDEARSRRARNVWFFQVFFGGSILMSLVFIAFRVHSKTSRDNGDSSDDEGAQKQTEAPVAANSVSSAARRKANTRASDDSV